MTACFGAVQALLATGGVWPKLMGWAPFRTWAEKAPVGVVADVEGALAAGPCTAGARRGHGPLTVGGPGACTRRRVPESV